MPFTRLSLTATPGRNYSFSAKGAPAGTHTGEFTELSLTATPGRRHSFSAKTAAGAGEHTGEFTELTVYALPGRRHSFTAKSRAPDRAGRGGKSSRKTERIPVERDDREIQEILTVLISTWHH